MFDFIRFHMYKLKKCVTLKIFIAMICGQSQWVKFPVISSDFQTVEVDISTPRDETLSKSQYDYEQHFQVFCVST